MTRSEHLQWAKARALQYVDAGDLQQAYSSMASDLRKHEELSGHTGIRLGFEMLMAGLLNDPVEMRKFINGFN
jgi:hypothetical protein